MFRFCPSLSLFRTRARTVALCPTLRSQTSSSHPAHTTRHTAAPRKFRDKTPPRVVGCCSCSRCRRRAKLKQVHAQPEQSEECPNTWNWEKSVFLSPFLRCLSFTYTLSRTSYSAVRIIVSVSHSSRLKRCAQGSAPQSPLNRWNGISISWFVANSESLGLNAPRRIVRLRSNE